MRTLGCRFLVTALSLTITGCALVPIVGPDNVVLASSDGGVTVDIVGGSADSWQLGVISLARDSECEACTDDDTVCHTLNSHGGRIAWTDDCDDAYDGATSIPHMDFLCGMTTYVLRPEYGAECWTWGDDPGYYVDLLGCVKESWEGSTK